MNAVSGVVPFRSNSRVDQVLGSTWVFLGITLVIPLKFSRTTHRYLIGNHLGQIFHGEKMLLEPAISTAISLTLLASATIPITLVKRRTRRRDDSGKEGMERRVVSIDVAKAMIRCGTAYALDSGDSVVIVISLSKEQGLEVCSSDVAIPVMLTSSEEVEVSA